MEKQVQNCVQKYKSALTHPQRLWKDTQRFGLHQGPPLGWEMGDKGKFTLSLLNLEPTHVLVEKS